MQTDVGGKSIGKKIHELQTRSVDKLVEFCGLPHTWKKIEYRESLSKFCLYVFILTLPMIHRKGMYYSHTSTCKPSP